MKKRERKAMVARNPVALALAPQRWRRNGGAAGGAPAARAAPHTTDGDCRAVTRAGH